MDAIRLSSLITMKLRGQLEQPAVEMLITGWAALLLRLVTAGLRVEGGGGGCWTQIVREIEPNADLERQFQHTQSNKRHFCDIYRNLLGYCSYIKLERYVWAICRNLLGNGLSSLISFL